MPAVFVAVAAVTGMLALAQDAAGEPIWQWQPAPTHCTPYPATSPCNGPFPELVNPYRPWTPSDIAERGEIVWYRAGVQLEDEIELLEATRQVTGLDQGRMASALSRRDVPEPAVALLVALATAAVVVRRSMPPTWSAAGRRPRDAP